MLHSCQLALAASTLMVAAACVRVEVPSQLAPSPAPTPAAQAKQDEDKKDAFKPWEEVLKDTRAIPGYLTFHLKRDNTLFLELKPDQLDVEFGMILHFSQGVADLGLNNGLPADWESRLVRFRRVGDEIHLVQRNPRYTATAGGPMQRAVDQNVGHSVLAAFKILSEHKETKAVAADVTSFFVSDFAAVGEWLQVLYRNRAASFDKERSHVAHVMGFPRNVELDVSLTFRATGLPLFGAEGVADYRSVPVGVRYSLFALPEQPMRPRPADDRVGYFLTAVWDFSRDREPTSFVRYVNRWRLEKKDHSSVVSEPVQPITYYIDRTVPAEYRRYVKEGIEGWNKAFEQAGFRNAIVALEAPEGDTTWSAEDMRYSAVRWTADRGAWAIGPSQVDPRTGEILNADILIAAGYVTWMLREYQELAGPDPVARLLLAREGSGGAEPQMFDWFRLSQRLHRELPRLLAQRLCFAQAGRMHQLGLQYALLVGLGVLDGEEPLPEEYMGDAIRDLVMHEVGHTLGLRHNFKGSSGIPYDRLHDPGYTKEHGVTLSVMDYGPVNVAPDPKRQGHFWNKEVGSYDVWAIQYGYTTAYEQPSNGALAQTGVPVATAEAERIGLAKIARRGAEPLHAYGTDEDMFPDVDPLTNPWDLGSDPLRYARDRASLVARVQPRLEQRLIKEGDGYQRLRSAFTSLLVERWIATWGATKLVGGMYVARDHKGDPNARHPFTPVPAERQREAVRQITGEILGEDAFRTDPEFLNKLAASRWAHWGVPWFVVPLDFPIHAYVGSIQSFVLEDLMSPLRLTRMIDNQVRMPRGTEAYPVSELFGTVTAAIWGELGDGTRPRNVTSFRRNLQRAHIGQLTRLVVDFRAPWLPAYGPEDARSLARLELVTLRDRIGRALQGQATLDTETRAHLLESQARIGRALEASVTLPPGR